MKNKNWEYKFYYYSNIIVNRLFWGYFLLMVIYRFFISKDIPLLLSYLFFLLLGIYWGYKLANGDKCPLRRWRFARERISCYCHHRAMPQNPSQAWGGSRESPERSGRPFVVACLPAHLSRRLRPRRADGATAPFRASMK